jgi:hypothetical protein
MDLAIGPTSSLYPSRLVQRAVDDPRSMPAQAEPGSAGPGPVGAAGVGITLSPQALLVLQSLGSMPVNDGEAKAEETDAAVRGDPSGRQSAAGTGRPIDQQDGQDPASGPDISRADLIGARTAYRMAASTADAGHGGVSAGVDLAA